jgi:hypothetical protein
MEEGRLAWLTAYIVDFFHEVGPEEKTLRELGGLLVREIARAVRSAETREAGPVPAALRRMQDYLSSRLETTLAVRHLARSGVVQCGERPSSLSPLSEHDAAPLHRPFADGGSQTPFANHLAFHCGGGSPGRL